MRLVYEVSIRFHPDAAEALKAAIDEAGGVEVFAIGELEDHPRSGAARVRSLEVHCRGTAGAVPALLQRPRSGQVVIHNHPSGNLEPSAADFELAARYGDEGIGVVIVDSAVTRDNWVVEPATRAAQPVDRDRLRAFFLDDLPRVLPGCESRRGQLDMALAMADALDEGGVLIAEAGTGTGKSLAYLVPAVLWATANDAKVAVSTYTLHLQSQLLNADIPLIRAAGIDFHASLIKGRNNYLCRRKLALAAQDAGEDRGLMQQLLRWSEEGASEGTRQELGESLAAEQWERVESDAHQTLRARCEHYNRCFYYQSRRRAGASHLLVMNHALMMADRMIKDLGAAGVVPRYDRVILDEGHHLEDAATGAGSSRLTVRALSRALSPLLDGPRRKGALSRIERSPVAKRVPQVVARVHELTDAVANLRHDAENRFRELAMAGLGDQQQLRLTPAFQQSEGWTEVLQPSVEAVARRLEDTAFKIAGLQEAVDLRDIGPEHAQPWLDLARARARLEHYSDVAWRFLGTDEALCRWLERDAARDLYGGLARVCAAPVDVGPLLRKVLFDATHTVGVTSATLSVNRHFTHYLRRHGLGEGEGVRTELYPSPFDYGRQSVLALPRDIPPPDRGPGWLDAAGRAVVELTRVSGGGAFVLCTSYEQIQHFTAQLRAGGGVQVFAQGEAPRQALLARYLENPGAVLVGTDSFWEGVSVKGEALRLVVIPRLPFRVPTEPVAQARTELLERQGLDPFRVMALPQAVIKLRQGFGRLIRTQTDRGAVVILDRRLMDRWYGRAFLHSLPPARRITGPTRVVLQRLAAFYNDGEQR